MGNAWANRTSAENTVTSATLSAEGGTSTNSITAAFHTPISQPASRASASWGGRPYRSISGASQGATAATTPVTIKTSVTIATGTTMRTSSQ